MMITRRCFLKLSSAALLSLASPKGATAAIARIPVLMYHDIGTASHEYETVAPAQFAAQMEWLYAAGYSAVSIAELGALFARNAGKVVVITADDGHASFMDYAFYYLREYGFKATINVVGKYVGGYTHENHPRLSWDECRYLRQSGLVEIGCHTYDLHDQHERSLAASLAAFNEKLEQDLLRFQRVYARELGKNADILAWPHGRYDQKSIEIARKAGFKYLMNSEDRHVKYDTDLSNIPRLTVANTTDLAAFRSFFEDTV